jgi:hypothetical protein
VDLRCAASFGRAPRRRSGEPLFDANLRAFVREVVQTMDADEFQTLIRELAT